MCVCIRGEMIVGIVIGLWSVGLAYVHVGQQGRAVV